MNTIKRWLHRKSKRLFVILFVLGITLCFLTTVARGPVSRDTVAAVARGPVPRDAASAEAFGSTPVARGPVPRSTVAAVARGPVPRDAASAEVFGSTPVARGPVPRNTVAPVARGPVPRDAASAEAFDSTPVARGPVPRNTVAAVARGPVPRDAASAEAFDSTPVARGPVPRDGLSDARDDVGAEENLILIPAGTFTMGSERRAADEKPVHKIYLDAYYISKYEVTNAEYYEFWASRHALPVAMRPHTPENFAHLPHIGTWPERAKQFPNHPVVGVSWHDAKAYAAWQGMRLPTEAEWEKAARGYTDRTWPWGNAMEPYANTSAADDGYENQLAPVGSFPKGKSYYGVLDMAGNVWEWTSDWYSDVYYFRSARRNPLGPDVGSWRVIRGGSWIDALPRCSTTFRFYLYPRLKTSFVGFRLVKAAEKREQ